MTLYKGIYSGCPVELAPTGYLLWCLDNNFMENILADIYTELTKRKLSIDEGFAPMPKPMSDVAWQTYAWFENWDEPTQSKFMSMVYNDSNYLSPNSKRFVDYYNNIVEKLEAYSQANLPVTPIEEVEVTTEYQQHYNNFFNQLFARK